MTLVRIGEERRLYPKIPSRNAMLVALLDEAMATRRSTRTRADAKRVGVSRIRSTSAGRLIWVHPGKAGPGGWRRRRSNSCACRALKWSADDEGPVDCGEDQEDPAHKYD
jgi:hypothetical protein